MQLFQRAIDPFSGGLFGAAKRLADGAKVALLEKAGEDGGAILSAQLVDGIVEKWSDRRKIGVGLLIYGIHFNSVLFAQLAAALRTQGFTGDKTRVPVQPAAQHHIWRERPGQPRQVKEHGLSDVFGQMRVTIDQPQRGRIDQVNVALHQFAECLFGPVLDVLVQQLLRFQHFSLLKTHREKKADKKRVGS
jgi:hypothetical protein